MKRWTIPSKSSTDHQNDRGDNRIVVCHTSDPMKYGGHVICILQHHIVRSGSDGHRSGGTPCNPGTLTSRERERPTFLAWAEVLLEKVIPRPR
jgi:hypothetical protein